MSSSNRLRQKFRQQIRSRQISQMMKIQREKALSNSMTPNIFMLMDEKIKHHAKLPTDMKIVEELVEFIDLYPMEENTYILVGNYVIGHGDAYRYFQMRLLGVSQVAKKLENYKWALLIILTRSQQTSSQILPQYDQTLSQIIQQSSLRQLPNTLTILHLILTLQSIQSSQSVQSGQTPKKYTPKTSLHKFFLKISTLPLKQLKPDLQYSIMAVVHGIGEYHMEHDWMREYVEDFVRVIVVGVEDYCTFRGDFVGMLRVIAVDWLEEFQGVFGGQLGVDLVNQMMYMFKNLRNQRTNLLTIFEIMVTQFSYQLLLQLLSSGLHLCLLSAFQDKTPQHLTQILHIFHQIFRRIQQKQQQQTLNKLMNHLQQNKFEVYLQDLFNQRQEPELEKVMKELVDDYYSDQVL